MNAVKMRLLTVLLSTLTLLVFFGQVSHGQEVYVDEVNVQQGGMPSFGNYDGVYFRTHTQDGYDCECWKREDMKYSIGRGAGGWYVFEHSECPPLRLPMAYSYGQITNAKGCDPTVMGGVSAISRDRKYVATNGVDADGRGGSPEQPYRTIQRALKEAKAGTTINVLEGNYDIDGWLTWANSGTSGNPITLTNYRGSRVTLSGTSETALEMILVRDRSHISIKNMTLQNHVRNNAKGIFVTGSGDTIKILNNEITNIGYAAWSSTPAQVPSSSFNASPLVAKGAASNPLRNVRISGNEIYRCTTGYSEALTVAGNVDGFTISHNTVRETTNIGIDVAGFHDTTYQARNGTVSDNEVYDLVRPPQLDLPAGIYADGALDVVIERNLVRNHGVGFSIGCETSGTPAAPKTAERITLRNNIAHSNGSSGLFLGSTAANATVRDCQVSNNTFYQNLSDPASLEHDTLIQRNVGREITLFRNEDSQIFQNIIIRRDFDPATQCLRAIGDWNEWSVDPVIDHNLYGGANTEVCPLLEMVTSGPGAVYEAPVFMEARPFDLRLARDRDGTLSPGIDAGRQNFAPAEGETDFADNPRILSGRVDIGALESYKIKKR